MSEVEVEPIRGLPEELPPGERILWQGEPRWTTLARHAFHIRSIAIYFAVLVVARGLTQYHDGQTPSGAFYSALLVVPLALAGLGILALLAWGNARSTVYTITNRRVVMRYGLAIPMTVNIPFRIIGDAALKTHANGDGDLPLSLLGRDRLAYLHLWPHARPWRFKDPEPMLRAIPEASKVASLLALAIRGEAGGAAQAPVSPVKSAEREADDRTCASSSDATTSGGGNPRAASRSAAPSQERAYG